MVDVPEPEQVNLNEQDYMSEYMYNLSLNIALSEFLNEIISGPTLIVSKFLEASIYLGPIRKIPERTFNPALSPDHSRWAHGLAAWDILHDKNNENLLNAVSTWLEDENKLNTKYQIKRREDKVISSESYFHALMQGPQTGIAAEDIYAILDEYEK